MSLLAQVTHIAHFSQFAVDVNSVLGANVSEGSEVDDVLTPSRDTIDKAMAQGQRETIEDLFVRHSDQTAEGIPVGWKGISEWRVFLKPQLLMHQLTPRSALACLQAGADPESLRPRTLGSFWRPGLDSGFQMNHHKDHENRRCGLMTRVRGVRQQLQMEEIRLWNTKPRLDAIHEGRFLGEHKRGWMAKGSQQQRHEVAQMMDFEKKLADDAEQQRAKLGQDERQWRDQQQRVAQRQSKLQEENQTRQLELERIEAQHRAQETQKAELERGRRVGMQLKDMHLVLKRQSLERGLKFVVRRKVSDASNCPSQTCDCPDVVCDSLCCV